MPSGHIRTFEEIEEIVNNLGYELLDEYIWKKYKRRIVIQDDNGYKWDGQLTHLIEQSKGRFFDVSNPHMLTNIALWLNLNRPEFEMVDGNIYRGIKGKLKFFHNIQECQEEFEMNWDNIFHGQGCPICRGMQVGKRNSLAYLRPDLKEEWHPDNEKTPEEVVCGCNGRFYWICSECGYGKNKEWITSIVNRANRGSGCPRCADEQKESKIATELKQWCKGTFKYIDPEHKMFKNPETNQWLRCDIYIGKPESTKGIYIEVHGPQHYKLSGFHYLQARRNGTTLEEEFKYCKKLDRIKKKFAKKNGLYIEVDLRKIKTIEQAIEYVESKL